MDSSYHMVLPTSAGVLFLPGVNCMVSLMLVLVHASVLVLIPQQWRSTE